MESIQYRKHLLFTMVKMSTRLHHNTPRHDTKSDKITNAQTQKKRIKKKTKFATSNKPRWICCKPWTYNISLLNFHFSFMSLFTKHHHVYNLIHFYLLLIHNYFVLVPFFHSFTSFDSFVNREGGRKVTSAKVTET